MEEFDKELLIDSKIWNKFLEDYFPTDEVENFPNRIFLLCANKKGVVEDFIEIPNKKHNSCGEMYSMNTQVITNTFIEALSKGFFGLGIITTGSHVDSCSSNGYYKHGGHIIGGKGFTRGVIMAYNPARDKLYAHYLYNMKVPLKKRIKAIPIKFI